MLASRFASPTSAASALLVILALQSGCFSPSSTGTPDETGGGETTDDESTTRDDVDTDTPQDTDPTGNPSTTDDPSATNADPSDTASSSGSATTDADEPCTADNRACVPGVGAPWSGPAAVILSAASDPAPACLAPYTDESVVAGSDASLPPAQCDCDCAAPAGVTCEDSTELGFYDLDGVDCPLDLVFSFTLQDGENVTLDQDMSFYSYSWSWYLQPVDIEGGSCNPVPTTTLPSAELQTRMTICAGPSAQYDCADSEVCAPMPAAPFESAICVWAADDRECPVGYPEKQLVHRSIDDNRGCSACTCGSPQGECVGTVATLHAYTGQGVEVLQDVPAATCTGILNDVTEESAELDSGTPDASCTPSAVNPTGAASVAEPVTVCCTAR